MNAFLLCLALTVQQEAGGEPPRTQVAVVHTIRNRSKRHHKSACWVVRQTRQFQHSRHYLQNTLKVVRRAWRLPDSVRGATHFHDPSVKPYWAKRFTRVARIGNLIFYREPT